MNEQGKQWFRGRSVKALFIAVFLPLGAVAQETPWDVEDLVDIRASSGERALVDRGYVFVKARRGDDRVWTNWWNRSTHTCITVATVNGRYDSIVDTPPFDCGRDDMTSGGTPDRRSWTSELVGARATALSGEMESRGFDNVDGYKDDDTVYTWWYHSGDDACLRAEVSDGRIQGIVPTPHFHACQSERGGGESAQAVTSDEAACVRAVKDRAATNEVSVLSYETSEANNLVMLRDGYGVTWRCLINDGRVVELNAP